MSWRRFSFDCARITFILFSLCCSRSFLGRVEAGCLLRGVLALQGSPLQSHSRFTRDLITKRSMMAESSSKDLQPLDAFLEMRKTKPTNSLVIGNEAGDADSIISAIALAYVDSIQGVGQKTPIVSIPREDLETQRPETSLLLELAGISHAVDHLLFVNSPFIVDNAKEAHLTLVDHNRLSTAFDNKKWKVVEILDHHYDEGAHQDTCKDRRVAFADNRALVASTCTLIAERIDEWESCPSSLGVVLVGTILLDSVNQLPAAGKVTQRDRDAIQSLLDKTDWSGLSDKAKETMKLQESSGKPDTTELFNALQSAKFNLLFWKGLSVRDALRLDYKRFENSQETFGVSTVLMSHADFLEKSDLVQSIQNYMKEKHIRFFGILLTSTADNGGLKRQICLCALDAFPLQDIIDCLRANHTLRLEEMEGQSIADDGAVLTIRSFDQANAKASRKQVAPILIQCVEALKDS